MRFTRTKFATLVVVLSLATASEGCGRVRSLLGLSPGKRATLTAKGAGPASNIHWKGVLMTGDDSIVAFDNARGKLKTIWTERGVLPADIRELSMTPKLQVGAVKPSSTKNLETALKSLKLKTGDGCVLHLTSHGAPWGFYLRDQKALSPTKLDALLTSQCGDRPTVVFIAACFSGIFTSNAMKKPNRAIFTAARDDRTSFGCGVENHYTFWDDCAIELLPAATNWADLQDNLRSCIRDKERGSGLKYSYPQAFIGAKIAKLPVFGKAGEP